jgi:hypothetical protein
MEELFLLLFFLTIEDKKKNKLKLIDFSNNKKDKTKNRK